MPGMRKEIKKETHNIYGGASRQVEIEALVDHGTFKRVLRMDSAKDEDRINGTCFYTIKRKSSQSGHTRTEAYIDDR